MYNQKAVNKLIRAARSVLSSVEGQGPMYSNDESLYDEEELEEFDRQVLIDSVAADKLREALKTLKG